MSASKGKKWERRLVNTLRTLGLVAERVPRSVCDAQGIDDVVVVPPAVLDGLPEPDNDDRPITRHLAAGRLPLSAVDQVEVKYTSSGAYGVKGLLGAHLAGCGLGTMQPVQWTCGHLSGGPLAWVEWMQDGGEGVRAYQHDAEMAKSAAGLLGEGVDAAAIRSPRNPWVVIWS